MAKYKTIKDVLAAIGAGDLTESNLRVVQDNDCSHIYDESQPDPKWDDSRLCVWEGNGYGDTDELWKLVLPKADVEWC